MFGIKKLTTLVEKLYLHNIELENDILALSRDIERNQKSVVNAFTMLRKPTKVETAAQPMEYRDANGCLWRWGVEGWYLV